MVSILLVPGYVDAEEVRGIAGYIAGLMEEYGVNIPLVLLAFHRTTGCWTCCLPAADTPSRLGAWRWKPVLEK
ncbi:hypothetical protein CF15_04915 [Pyrodictium occultum]|uniref:Uncharacterized protein n=1 Tax=Pyrodictium occultum TaxID=2309 RepID=A0A0V8RVP4_PYROC|nr:hypothetical protein [Pyrodictium occultum]KSW12112.1 hypothetical protein CF15_04915 [Pyrodictium occultum]